MVQNQNSIRRFAFGLWISLGVMTCHPCVVRSQDQTTQPQNQPGDKPTTTEQSQPPGADYDETVKPKVATPKTSGPPQSSPPRPLTVRERQRLQRANQAARNLVQESEQAFDRGLMSLQDHLLQLQTADDVALSAAAMQDDSSALRQVLRHRVERLGTIRNGYRSVNNYWPIAPGDQALVETLLAQAQAELAAVEDERQTDRRAAANAHVVDWTERLTDATELEVVRGSGTPEEVLQARKIRSDLRIPPENITAIQTALRDQRQEQAVFVQQLEQWAGVGSPLGRADRLAAARFELARLDYDLANLHGRANARETAFRNGMQASSDWHAALAEYYPIGTASLFDLATAWQQRRGMVAQFTADTETSPDRIRRGLSQDFQEIRQMAAATQDRRGRIAADVQFVEVLGDRVVVDQIAAARWMTRR